MYFVVSLHRLYNKVSKQHLHCGTVEMWNRLRNLLL